MKKQAAAKVWKPTKVKYSTAKMYDNPAMFGGVVESARDCSQNFTHAVPATIGAFVWVNRWGIESPAPVIAEWRETTPPTTTRHAPAKPSRPATIFGKPWIEETAPARSCEADEYQAICNKYAWISQWENDPKKCWYKSTIQNGKVNRRAEVAAHEAKFNGLNVTAEFAKLPVNA